MTTRRHERLDDMARAWRWGAGVGVLVTLAASGVLWWLGY